MFGDQFEKHKPAHYLPFRRRLDLKTVDQSSSRGTCCTVKDPAANRYWQLDPEEAFILKSLDACTSARELRSGFERQFAPRRLTEQQLTAVLARFHAEGLLVTDRPGQSEAIFERLKQWRRLAPLRLAGQICAWRFRGIDADRWLARIAPRFAWLFTSFAAALLLLLLTTALSIVGLHWPALVRDFVAAKEAFTADQVLWVLATIAAAKVLHELGHAIACKHFGGECHELGFLLLFGTPSLYCNVSDAWMLTRKSSRILISAAGILVELTLASVCVWLWWFTFPGFAHTLAIYVVVVCSVNTLLINGNPLLQYDGYYVLSDWTDTPNLRNRSREAVNRLLARWILGLRRPSKETQHRAIWLALYGIASGVYRWVVVVGLVWWLQGYLAPYGAQFLAWIVGALMCLALLAVPAVELVRFLRRPDWDRDLPWRWVAPRALLFATACLALLLMPLPAHVVAPLMLDPRGSLPVYATVEGKLVWAIAPGTPVSEGGLIARLENLPLAAELARLTGERNARRQRLTNLMRRQSDPVAAAEIPTAQKSLADTEERLTQRRRDVERLEIRAPRSGIVLPPPSARRDQKTTLRWTGTPLDAENLGCHLQTGDEICIVGDPQVMDAFVFVAQGSEDLIKPGQQVDLLVDSFPNRRFSGSIVIPPTTRTSQAPEELLAVGELPVERDSQGKARPKQALFEARIELDTQEQALLIGGTGRAKVAVDPQSIAHRLWRTMGQTFRGL